MIIFPNPGSTPQERKKACSCCVIIQMDGLAALVNPMKKDGTLFVILADGAVQDCHPAGKHQTLVTFCRSDFVAGIVHSSLLGRLCDKKVTKCKCTTLMQPRVQRFHITDLATPKVSSSLLPNKEGSVAMGESAYHVVEVWFALCASTE